MVDNLLIDKFIRNEMTLREVLINLPEDRERIFENNIIELIGKSTNLEDKALEILINKNEEEYIAYKAFYLLCSLYRRRKDITIYGGLFGKYGRRFEKNHTYGYLKAMYLVQTGIPEKIKHAAILSSKSLDKINDNVGIKHCYCEIVAEAFEERIFEINDEKDKSELIKASDAIEEIIHYSDENYAKFHCTYGRILALLGDYNNAKIEIKKAIDKEKSDRFDYTLRISEYIKHLMSISSLEQTLKVKNDLNKFESKMKSFNDKIDSSLNKNIEFLGFFAALVSFIMASVQIVSNYSVNEALKLIIVLGGVQMLVIGSFSLILTGKSGVKRYSTVFIMALITILLGIKLI